MKKIFLFFILFFSLVCSAQEPAEGVFPLKEDQIYYEKIVTVDSTNLSEILKRSRIWALDAFVSQKAALQVDDKDNGLLGYNSSFSLTFAPPPVLGISNPFDWNFTFTLKIYCKDNKAKMIIDDLKLKQNFKGDYNYKQKEEVSIFTYRKDTEEALARAMYGKKWRGNYYAEAKSNFEKANTMLSGLINRWSTQIQKKAESDF